MLAFAIIIWMFGQVTINSVFAYNYELISVKNNIEYTKSELKNIKNWDKYILEINTFIENISDAKAEALENKIQKLKNKFINRDDIISKKEENILTILIYLELKLEERKLLKEEQAKKEIFNNTLSDSDTKKVNDELVKIQKSLLKQGVNNFEKILWELETYTNFEEKWNFEAKFNMDIADFWKSKASLKLKDYVSRNSWFDTQFKTKIEAIIEAAPKWKDEVKMKFNAFIDYIIKDQNYYVLLKNLKIIDEKDIPKIDSYLEKIKEIATKNKYIKIENKNTQEIISQLKQFNPNNILKQGNSIVEKPLFTAYKKEWSKFYLIPSKYGCDTAKTLSKKFDPFNGNTCTDSQYQNLLSDIADSKAEFYIDFSSRNTIIWFESQIDWMEELNWNIIFSDKYIEEINFNIKPNQENYPWELASLNFIRANKLDVKIYADSWKVNLNLKSTLDWLNRFKTIDLDYNFEEKFKWNLILKNRKISWKYSWEWYNDKYVWIITWRTDTSNKLSQLKVSNQYINSSSWNSGETNTTLEYNYGKYSIDNKYTSKWLKSDLQASFKISRKILSEANFKLKMFVKDYSYDENYNVVYNWDFEKVVDSDISLKNKKIKWITTLYNKNKEYLKITNSWKYEKDELILNTKFNFLNEALEKFSQGFNYSSWLNIEPKKIEWNLNIKIDTKSSRNNFNIYADLKLDDKKNIELELDNKSNKIYKKDVKILAPLPNDTIPLEEVFENPNMY